MIFFKVLKFFRHSDVPYTPLVDMETRYIPVVNNTGSSITMEPVQINKSLDEVPMPLAFQKMLMSKNPRKGQLASFGIFTISIALCGAPIVAAETLAKLPKLSSGGQGKVGHGNEKDGERKKPAVKVTKTKKPKSKSH